MTLAFGKTLGKLLEASGRYRVVYTRDDDSYISLGERVAIARRNDADLFVSIHANSFPGGSVRGAIVYTVSDQASDKMAAALADTENQSDALAGIDVNAADSDDVKNILDRPDPPRDAQFRRRLRPQPGQGTRQDHPPVQGSPPGGELQGAGGAGRALGAGRTRLSDQPQRRQADGDQGVAGKDRRNRSSRRSTTISAPASPDAAAIEACGGAATPVAGGHRGRAARPIISTKSRGERGRVLDGASSP